MQTPSSSVSTVQPRVTPQQRTQFFIAVSIGLCLLFVISYTGRMMAKSQAQRDLAAQVEKNQIAHERTAQLQARLAYVQSDAYVEEKAREEFSMAQPGDRKVVILPDPDASGAAPAAPVLMPAPPGEALGSQPAPSAAPAMVPTTAAPEVKAGLPIWRQWLALLEHPPFANR